MNGSDRRRRALRLAANSASLISSAVAIRATSFVVYVMVARYRGAFEFGQLSLATTVFAILLEIALLGVRRVVVRDVAVDGATARGILANAGLLTALGSAAALAVAWTFVRVMDYAPATASLIVLVALALWPAALAQIAESVAQGWERTQWILAVNVPVGLAKVGVVFVALERGLDVSAVAWILVAAYLATAVLSYGVILWRSPAAPVALSVGAALSLARSGAPFLGINLTTSVRSNLGTILVSGFLGETAVGLFNAANQLTVPVRLVYENLVSSFFPSMVRRFRAGAMPLRELVGRLMTFVSALTMPLVVALFVLAEPLLLALYAEPEFAGAAIVLMITVWSPLLDTLKGIMGHAMWAGRHEGAVLRVTLVNLAVSVASGLVLIPAFGLVGAAANVLVVSGVNLVQHWLASRRTLDGLPLFRPLWWPLTATLVMAGILYLARPLGLVLGLALALLAYGTVLVILMLREVGGVAALRTRYIEPWLG